MTKKEKQTIRLYHKQLVKEIFPFGVKPKFKIGQVVEVKKSSNHIFHKKIRQDEDLSWAWAYFDKTRERLIGKKGSIVEIDFARDNNSEGKEGLISYMVRFGKRDISLCEEWLK